MSYNDYFEFAVAIQAQFIGSPYVSRLGLASLFSVLLSYVFQLSVNMKGADLESVINGKLLHP